MNPSIYAYSRFCSSAEAPGPLLYAHGNIIISPESITLKAYYMPNASPKKLRFRDIIELEEVKHSFWGIGAWGSGPDCRVWWHWDWCLRGLSKKRRRGIVLHTRTGMFAAGLSPRAQDYDRVLHLIQERIEIETSKIVACCHDGSKTREIVANAQSESDVCEGVNTVADPEDSADGRTSHAKEDPPDWITAISGSYSAPDYLDNAFLYPTAQDCKDQTLSLVRLKPG